MKRSHLRRHGRAYLVIGGILSFILLAIWSNMIVPSTIKVILSVCAMVILLLLVIVAYRDATHGSERPSTPPARVSLPTTAQIPIVPPKPRQPPRSALYPTPTPILYDHRPRPIPAIGYSLLVAVILVALCMFGIYAQTDVTGVIVTVCGVIAVAFCYWQWIKWSGTHLIITEESKQLQRALPWPFEVNAPAMPNKIGTVQDVKQTFVDRLFGTCRLFSDIKAEGDEVFHSIKWLPYPKELRQALGQRPLRSNSWLPFSRKNF